MKIADLTFIWTCVHTNCRRSFPIHVSYVSNSFHPTRCPYCNRVPSSPAVWNEAESERAARFDNQAHLQSNPE